MSLFELEREDHVVKIKDKAGDVTEYPVSLSDEAFEKFEAGEKDEDVKTGVKIRALVNGMVPGLPDDLNLIELVAIATFLKGIIKGATEAAGVPFPEIESLEGDTA